MKRLVLRMLRAYQDYRQLRPPACRFLPTCTSYAEEAIESHGLPRGAWLSARRVARCHPLGGHGHDPVPVPQMRSNA